MSDLRVRPAIESDLPALTRLYNHYVADSPATFDLQPFTVDERREWLREHPDSGPHRIVIAEAGGSLLGYASSSRFRNKAAYETSVETTVYLDPEHERRGIATRLYEALFALIDGEDLHRAYAGITVPNPRSVALHIRFGFRSVGVYEEVGRKFDRYWSVEWFEKELG